MGSTISLVLQMGKCQYVNINDFAPLKTEFVTGLGIRSPGNSTSRPSFLTSIPSHPLSESVSFSYKIILDNVFTPDLWIQNY